MCDSYQLVPVLGEDSEPPDSCSVIRGTNQSSGFIHFVAECLGFFSRAASLHRARKLSF